MMLDLKRLPSFRLFWCFYVFSWLLAVDTIRANKLHTTGRPTASEKWQISVSYMYLINTDKGTIWWLISYLLIIYTCTLYYNNIYKSILNCLIDCIYRYIYTHTFWRCSYDASNLLYDSVLTLTREGWARFQNFANACFALISLYV